MLTHLSPLACSLEWMISAVQRLHDKLVVEVLQVLVRNRIDRSS